MNESSLLKIKSVSLLRKRFVQYAGIIAIGLLLYSQLWANTSSNYSRDIRYVIANQFNEAEIASLNGHIGKTLKNCFKNDILVQDFDHLIEPFSYRNETSLWQTEFWGKSITASVLAYRYRPEAQLKEKMRSAVESLIATQTPDGYIGNYKQESRLKQWDIWGMKYCLLGLLDYYDLSKDKRCLNAASKLADYLIAEINRQDGKIVNKGNYRGMAASSVLLPMARLSVASGNKRYLDFAKEIVRQWETPDGPKLISKSTVNVSERFPRPAKWYSREQGQKAYEMMSCYEGLLELYRLTGQEEYKHAVTNTFENILKSEINIAGSGASAEMWFGGKELQTTPVFHYQETCVTVTWLRLCNSLLKLTGDVKYANAIETTYYNAMMASLKHDGFTWAKYTPLNGERLPGSGQCGMNLNCCSANGPRGLFLLPQLAVMNNNEGIAVNFFAAGSYQVHTPSGKKINITQKTNYPASGDIDILLEMKAAEDMTMLIRIPEWSKQASVFINGEKQQNVEPGSYIKIKRKWKTNDKISLQLDMRGRVVMMGNKHKYFALMSGPLVLSRDTRFPGTDLGVTITPLKEDYIELKKLPTNEDEIWVRYEASFQAENYKEKSDPPITVLLCDYASAGNGSGHSSFQTWMPFIFNPAKDN